MLDSLAQQTSNAGIPDVGLRVAFLVVIILVLAVTGVLLYLKMKEADEKIDGLSD